MISRINRRFMSVLVELEHPIESALGSGLHISNTVKRGVNLSGEILHGVFGVCASAWGGWGGWGVGGGWGGVGGNAIGAAAPRRERGVERKPI